MSSETTHRTDEAEAVVGEPAGTSHPVRADEHSERGSSRSDYPDTDCTDNDYDSCEDLMDRDDAYYNNNASDGEPEERGEANASSGDDLGMQALSVTSRRLSDTDLMPPPGVIPDEFVCQVDRYTGRVTTRDGLEIFVDPTQLGDDHTAPTKLDRETRNAILRVLSEEDRNSLPAEWLVDYASLARGLGTSRVFREAVVAAVVPTPQPEAVVYSVSAQAAGGQDVVLEAAAVLHAMGGSVWASTSDASHPGVVTQYLEENQSEPVGDASNASVIREQVAPESSLVVVKTELEMENVTVLQDTAAPEGAEGGVGITPMDVEASPPTHEVVTNVTLTTPTERPAWVALTTEQLNAEATRIANERKSKGQQALLELKEETRRLEAQKKELDERKRQLRKEEKADKERLAALEEERLAQEAKVAKDGFEVPTKDRRKAAKAKKIAAAAKAKAAEIVSESESDTSDASDAPTGLEELISAPSPKLRDIWDNARKKFMLRRPACFSECEIGRGQYSCPPMIDFEGESDDEEWIRLNRKDESVNLFYERMMNVVRNAHNEYYSHDAKSKLAWAAANYGPNNMTCAFDSCIVAEFSWPTRARFLRHLVEVHHHHHPNYECFAEIGKQNKKCTGISTKRRSEMIRHLKEKHGLALKLARQRVIDLHADLYGRLIAMPESEYLKVKVCSGAMCLTGTDQDKQRARFAMSQTAGRMGLSAEIFWEVKCWRGDYDTLSEEQKEKRRKPSEGGSQPKRGRYEGRPESRPSSTDSSTAEELRRVGLHVSPLNRPRVQPAATAGSPAGVATDRVRAPSMKDWWQDPGANQGEAFPPLGPPAGGSSDPNYWATRGRGTTSSRGRGRGMPEERPRPLTGRGPRSSPTVLVTSRPITYNRPITVDLTGSIVNQTPVLKLRVDPSSSPSVAKTFLQDLKAANESREVPPPQAASSTKEVPRRAPKRDLPPGSIQTSVDDTSRYFSAEEKAASVIQAECFGKFQNRYRELSVKYTQDVLRNVVETVDEIQRREQVRIDHDKMLELQHRFDAVDRAEEKAQGAIAHFQEENGKLRKENTDYNIMFRAAFGVPFSEWDGSTKQAKELLLRQEAKNLARVMEREKERRPDAAQARPTVAPTVTPMELEVPKIPPPTSRKDKG